MATSVRRPRDTHRGLCPLAVLSWDILWRLQIVLHVELPGIPKEQTKLEVDPESCIVTLSGERKSACEETPEGSAFRRVERQWGMFERSFRLPDACRAKLGEIKARANNGVIEIHCPKAEPPKPVAISIQ